MIISAESHSQLDTDHRFKKWAKIVSKKFVDLTQKNGYSLTGRWVRWDESVSLNDGEYLVCAAETGSMKYHDYSYSLINSEGNIVPEDEINSIESKSGATDEQIARAHNSKLYSIALYVNYNKYDRPNVDALTAERNRLVERIAEIDKILHQD